MYIDLGREKARDKEQVEEEDRQTERNRDTHKERRLGMRRSSSPYFFTSAHISIYGCS